MMYKTMQNDSQISKISISILNDVTSYQLRNSKKKKKNWSCTNHFKISLSYKGAEGQSSLTSAFCNFLKWFQMHTMSSQLQLRQNEIHQEP